MIRTLANDDVVFVCPSADPSAYAKYGASLVAAGGVHSSDYVNKLRRQGIRTTGTMWCLTAGSHDLHTHPDLVEATARDIEGRPIAVPWLARGSFQETPDYFGCVNHPAFRAHLRRKVCDAMAGGPDGLHVDEHLGSAYTALHLGGCYCDWCMQGFANYLKKKAAPELLSLAKTPSFDNFDYCAFVKNIASTREKYLALQESVPLRAAFIDFQLGCASDNVVSLGKLAADVAGAAVSLSANVCLPGLEHTVVLPHLTYCASEVAHNAAEGASGLADAVLAYRMAETLGRPMASTATAQDWAFVKENGAEQLVRLWIALSYACGQRFMVPNRMLCSGKGGAPQWYCGSPSFFAPLYGFVKEHGRLLNDFKAVGPLAAPAKIPTSFETFEKRKVLAETLNALPNSPITAGKDAWVFPRVKNDGSVVVHVVNLAYNATTKRISPQKNVEIRMANALFKRNFSGATAFGCEVEPVKLTVRNEGGDCCFTVPELGLWSIVTFEYWA
ncbi:MAG TPA: hypothetical protein VLX68_02510 [Chitinivibrionales bacterium]|nr:hypothetical protein [Chitinivibrionales bacterium]